MHAEIRTYGWVVPVFKEKTLLDMGVKTKVEDVKP